MITLRMVSEEIVILAGDGCWLSLSSCTYARYLMLARWMMMEYLVSFT